MIHLTTLILKVICTALWLPMFVLSVLITLILWDGVYAETIGDLITEEIWG